MSFFKKVFRKARSAVKSVTRNVKGVASSAVRIAKDVAPVAVPLIATGFGAPPGLAGSLGGLFGGGGAPPQEQFVQQQALPQQQFVTTAGARSFAVPGAVTAGGATSCAAMGDSLTTLPEVLAVIVVVYTAIEVYSRVKRRWFA